MKTKNFIKSVIIKQDGINIIHLIAKPYGVFSEIEKRIKDIKITCLMDNGEKIILSNIKK